MEPRETILIADGDPLVREMLKALLFSQGYTLVFASSGPETLTKVEEITPDLILLDVMMPCMDGFEVCERLRATPHLAGLPIIMITPFDDSASRLRGLEVGVDDFITKPFDIIQLRARIRTITHLNRQRRLRSLELQAERDRTQAILEALGEAVVVTDVEGLIQYLNPAAVSLTGFSREEVLGHSWRLLQDEKTAKQLEGEILEEVRVGQTWRGEVMSRRKDDSLYDAALTVAPLFAPGNRDQPIGFVSVQRDITPLKKAERAKDEFVSNVSHELRTPLSVITLVGDNLDTLYDRLDDSRRRKMIHDIQKHSQVLKDLIGDVLELSRIDSARISEERGPLNLAQLAREEVDKILPLAQQQLHTLHVTSLECVPVLGNDNQLRQVIRNLLNNAIKYTPNGGQITCQCLILPSQSLDEVCDIEMSWPGYANLAHHRWAALQVIDTGIGISNEHLPRVFERFYRIQAQQNIRGTGLGLAIAQELVEVHGGHIAVASTPGQGSIFAIYLPLLEEV